MLEFPLIAQITDELFENSLSEQSTEEVIETYRVETGPSALLPHANQQAPSTPVPPPRTWRITL